MSLERISNIEFDKQKANILLQCLVFTLLASLSPFKILSYFLPILLLVFTLIRLFSRSFHKNLLFAVVIFSGIILFYFFKSFFLHYNFSLASAFLSLLTYGSIIFILVYPRFRVNYNSSITSRLNKFVYVVFVVETAIALLQIVVFLFMTGASLDLSSGDVIQGSINPFSFISNTVGFNNQVFTINYIFLLAYLIPYLRSKNQKVLIFLGAVVIILASVLHVIFSFILALVTCFLLVGVIKSRKQIVRFLFLGSFVTAFLYITQPRNFFLFRSYYGSLVSLESPKTLIIANTIAFLPQEYPDALVLGLGPGQYTSRASLISSGHYFGEFQNPTKLPFLSHSLTSNAFNDYVFDIWESYATDTDRFGNSTMSRPFFSILSLISEFGIIFFLAMIIILFRGIVKIRKRYWQLRKEKKKISAYYSFINIVSILFLFYLSFFENYLESSASICAGLLLIKYFNSLAPDR
jgi:hypothetical protein